MNIDAILELGKRNPDARAAQGINGPLFSGTDKSEVLITDTHVAFIIPTPKGWRSRGDIKTSAQVFDVIRRDFDDKLADISSFKTTVANLVEWLRASTDPCTFCAGSTVCSPAEREKHRAERGDDVEVAEALHFGWIGTVAIDRGYLDEALALLECKGDEEIVITCTRIERPHMHDGKDVGMFSAVRIVCKDAFEVFLGGKTTVQESSPKFHLEGKFEKVEFKASRTKPTKAPAKAAPPKPAPKKPAPKAPPSKKASKPVKQPVKAPSKPSGSSLLDAARARAAAGRKKK